MNEKNLNMFDTFIGQYINVYTTKKGFESTGYLVYMDSKYLYIGDHPEDFEVAIAISKVVAVQLEVDSRVKTDDEFYAEVLETIPNNIEKKDVQ